MALLRVPQATKCVKVQTHVSAKVPLTNAWVNEVFPTARKPRMATLRCTMAGSFFGIVLPKVCITPQPRLVRVIIIRELIAIARACIHSGKVRAVRVTSPHLAHAHVSFWAVTVTSSCKLCNCLLAPLLRMRKTSRREKIDPAWSRKGLRTHIIASNEERRHSEEA